MKTEILLHSDKKQINVFSIPLIAFLLLCFLYSTGQTGIHWCGSDIMRQKNFNEQPNIKQKNDSLESALLLAIKPISLQKKLNGGSSPTPMQIYIIPIVVHIIHNNGYGNISDAQVITGIQHLNDAFRNVGVFNPATGADMEIEFCLAKQDENGSFTSGINRIVSPLTNLIMETEDLTLKNLIRWDPTKYLNIWIVNAITSQSMGAGVAGYAYFPSSHGNPEDGIVNEATYFGTTPDNSKVAVHEVGHYLGLYHTFEGGCSNNNCLTEGDKVCDTPPDASTAPVSCGGTINTCQTDDDDLTTNNPFRPVGSGGTGDQEDMFINYMDYGYQTCQSAFTPGQKNRMVPSLTGIRGSLLQSTGCNNTCTNLITASFNASAINVSVGTSVSFTNTSSGSLSNIWQVNDSAFSTALNFSFTFNTAGSYIVKLIAANGDPSCTQEYTITVIVTCPVAASFTVSSNDVSPGDNVTFTNTSTGANSYQWYIDGILQGSTTNYNHTFPVAGGFMISLTASNGMCSNTFYQNVNVGICNSKEANIWYFGDSAGVDFNSNPPLALTNSAMPFVYEGCSSIADINGDLLFYTDGVQVWNKNHQVMPNGSGLMGHPSAYQSALIVKRPLTPGKYYIFTVDANENNYANGLRYSEVDITLNGGLGDIIVSTKNTLLYTPVAESLAGTGNCNGDIWVVATSVYPSLPLSYAYLVTSAGVSNIPVISSINGAAAIKFSPLRNKMASIAGPNGGLLYDFNKTTGVVSNFLAITLPGFWISSCEFSPDGSKLYFGGHSTVNNNLSIHQLDMEAGSQAAINNSSIQVFEGSIYGGFSAMQIGPDGKIYVSKTYYTSLAVVNVPNAPGALCNFVDEALDLNGRMGWGGLPNFISSMFDKGLPSITGSDSVCSNSDGIYSLKGCFSNIAWSLNGQADIVSSTDSTVSIHFNNPGMDTLVVAATGPCGTKKDTLFINVQSPNSFELGADTTICQGTTVVLNAGAGYTSYLWQDGSITQTLTVNTPGQYKVTVTNSGGCAATDSIMVSAVQTAPLNLGSDIFGCNGLIEVLDAGSNFSSYKWQDGSTNTKLTVYLPGKYWVTVSACGTISSDTITVAWESNIPFTISQEGDLCSGQSVALKADPADLASYIWDDGNGNNTREVQTPGTYWLIVTDANGCYDQDSVDVIFKNCNCVIAVPTAFSPNNDGHNDFFVLHGLDDCIATFTFMIFDRWGEQVFVTENVGVGWDGTYKGKSLSSSVFVYYISATLISGEKINKKGNISLIR